MAGPSLLPLTELKKNYKFLWYIGRDDNNLGLPYKVASQFGLLMNHVLTSYVAQMAETVNPPDDDLEFEDYNVASLKIPVVTGVKMNDIVVTYLDDTNDTVYNFHKSWQSFLRQGDTFCIEPVYPYTINARFVTIENTLTAEEYATIFQGVQAITSNQTLNNNKVIQSLSSLGNDVDIFIKPRSVYNYPHIFPFTIKRDPETRSGNGLSKVTVTYKRLPEIKKSKSYMNLKDEIFFVKNTHTRVKTEGRLEKLKIL